MTTELHISRWTGDLQLLGSITEDTVISVGSYEPYALGISAISIVFNLSESSCESTWIWDSHNHTLLVIVCIFRYSYGTFCTNYVITNNCNVYSANCSDNSNSLISQSIDTCYFNNQQSVIVGVPYSCRLTTVPLELNNPGNATVGSKVQLVSANFKLSRTQKDLSYLVGYTWSRYDFNQTSNCQCSKFRMCYH
jgi:hypothetical protein